MLHVYVYFLKHNYKSHPRFHEMVFYNKCVTETDESSDFYFFDIKEEELVNKKSTGFLLGRCSGILRDRGQISRKENEKFIWNSSELKVSY